MKRRYIGALLFLLVFTLSACGGAPAAPATPTPAPVEAPSPTPSPTPEPTPEPTPTPDPIAEAVAGMTVEQKVGQLLVAGIEGTVPGADAETAVAEYRVGGVILFGRNVEDAAQLAALTNGVKALNGDNTPLFLCVDEEGGRVSRMPPEVTDLPSAYQYVRDGGSGADRGRVLAAECAAFGFNVDFAPSLDIWSNPENTVIGDRAFGNDWEWAATVGNEAAAALSEGGVIPVVKHFPGHGDTAVDSHKALPVVDKTLEELRESELIPFRDAVRDGAPAVMVAHILMTQIDPERPASLSPAAVTGLLRGELDFGGVVFTDDLTMGAISNTYGMGEAAVLAFEAGCDALLVCHGADNLAAARAALLDAAASGRISQQRLDESVTRILALKAAYALDSDPVPEPDVAALNAQIAEILP